jgi:uncharacterized protein YodC (DUF2158 family)
MKEFKAGDPVSIELSAHLTTHRFTVLGHDVHGQVICYWYDLQRNLQTASFPADLLQLVPDEPAPDFSGAMIMS